MHQLVKTTGGRFKDDGTSKIFDELEMDASLIGDLVTSMAINQAAKELPEGDYISDSQPMNEYWDQTAWIERHEESEITALLFVKVVDIKRVFG